MTELAETFDELDLAQYLDRFLEQGFDTWDTILDITELNLYVLNNDKASNNFQNCVVFGTCFGVLSG